MYFYLFIQFFCYFCGVADSLRQKILSFFPYEPTAGQAALLNKLSFFLGRESQCDIFLLKGYAGTGKTSVVGALVKCFTSMNVPIVLAAPTGRAAKVLSQYAEHQAYTIHKLIYRQRTSAADTRFELGFNRLSNALFIVDECSMISNSGDSVFGSGCLLDDLLQYVFSGAGGCKLLMLGDDAQLPPVMQDESVALNADFLRGYGFGVEEFLLKEVVRQSSMSGILRNATMLRQALDGESEVMFSTDKDVVRVDGTNFTDCIEQSYREVGEDETLVITRSNNRAFMYADGIRSRILYREELLTNGDMLMVVKNNYSLPKEYGIEFVANGDIARVVRQRGVTELYGMEFADVTLDFSDYGTEVDMLILRDGLKCKTPAELSELQERLYRVVEADYEYIKNRRERYKKMREDKYLNALVVRSAYSVTCHKAQGGGWCHVYVDMGNIQPSEIDASTLRWLYTAVTRAKEKLHLVNFNDGLFKNNA
ncbi:MAG: AAA family ATPase [Paludibacteraceae bacterium]|nr:AAA family ATPase [Paludibacteraceae bacterium]